MTFRTLPSLTGLRAFEATARLGSFKLAAEELGVTPAAVRAQVQTLEKWFGAELLRRSHKHIEARPAALRLQSGLNDAFRTMQDAVEDFANEQHNQPLALAVGTLFASRWLSPRLSAFQQENPDIALKLTRAPTADEFENSSAQAMILWGPGHWPGYFVAPVFQPHMLPVAAPTYLQQHGKPDSPQALARHALIVEEDFLMWERWFKAHGSSVSQPVGKSTIVRDGSLAMQLALDGQGVYLAVAEFIQHELDSGTVLPLADKCILGTMAYHFACPQNLLANPRVASLKQWFLNQA